MGGFFGLFGLLVDLGETLIDDVHRDVEDGFAPFAHRGLGRVERQAGLVLFEEGFIALLSCGIGRGRSYRSGFGSLNWMRRGKHGCAPIHRWGGSFWSFGDLYRSGRCVKGFSTLSGTHVRWSTVCRGCGIGSWVEQSFASVYHRSFTGCSLLLIGFIVDSRSVQCSSTINAESFKVFGIQLRGFGLPWAATINDVTRSRRTQSSTRGDHFNLDGLFSLFRRLLHSTRGVDGIPYLLARRWRTVFLHIRTVGLAEFHRLGRTDRAVLLRRSILF